MSGLCGSGWFSQCPNITDTFHAVIVKSNRGGYRTAATSKVKFFVLIVNGFHLLAIITKSSTLDVAAVLDLPLSNLLLIDTFQVTTRNEMG